MSKIRAIIEAKEKDLSETEYFTRIQIRLWRALAIICAHHPELAKPMIRWMALNCWLTGEKQKLEKAVLLWTDYAKRCGVTAGIFEPDTAVFDDKGNYRRVLITDRCSGKAPNLLSFEAHD